MRAASIGAVIALSVIAYPSVSAATCNLAACKMNDSVTACYTVHYGCVNNCLRKVQGPRKGKGAVASPAQLPGCGTICDIVSETLGAPGAACESDGLACTTDVCGGTAPYGDGICHHNAVAGAECGGTCLSSGCCAAPNSCAQPPSGNGSNACSGNGGSCTLTCNSGYKVCNGDCIPMAGCCSASECTQAPANTHAVCGANHACSYACNADAKLCGTACIPIAQCCVDGDCAPKAGGCYNPGKCAAGTCTYTPNDGAACNADSNACTPNDTCSGGTCVADTAHQVKCVQRDCHTAPVCNTTTGNCDDSNVTNGSACGGNGCANATGTCTTGTCSVAPKDCTAFTTDCKVGVCDASGPIGTPCATVNTVNGTSCALADKCLLTTTCNGGTCVGTAKSCAPSGTCRVAMCNSSTGGCEESIAPVGTPCTPSEACVQNAQCDATGACVGSSVPDGTPCAKEGCADTSACVTSACICIENATAPVDDGGAQTDTPDMATPVNNPGKGCSLGGRAPAPSWPWVVLLAAALLWRRRGTV